MLGASSLSLQLIKLPNYRRLSCLRPWAGCVCATPLKPQPLIAGGECQLKRRTECRCHRCFCLNYLSQLLYAGTKYLPNCLSCFGNSLVCGRRKQERTRNWKAIARNTKVSMQVIFEKTAASRSKTLIK